MMDSLCTPRANRGAALSDPLAAAHIAEQILLARDEATGQHVRRVGQLSRLIAEQTADHYVLSANEIVQIGAFAPVHDLGKVGIPDSILLKTGRLDHDEIQLVRRHVDSGLALLDSLLVECKMDERPRLIYDLIALHHERLNGLGYPNGLSGSDIPPAGRIIAVADVFDALTADRPYRAAMPVTNALNLLDDMVIDGELDAVCVQAIRLRLDDVGVILASAE
jgi:HD-GYP domain-containing protein (c-di-GMP phosphodiesterase class II)